jgi:lauroyl/myristoyl acyltransferase
MARDVSGYLLRIVAQTAVAILCVLPVRWAAYLGRAGGRIVYCIDGRHRRMAQKNLQLCFGASKSAVEITEIAKENFRRIGENICCAIKSTTMTEKAVVELLEVTQSKSAEAVEGFHARNVTMATGHFGCFELFSQVGSYFRQYRQAATYRGIRQQGLDDLLLNLRQRSGVKLFERRGGAESLKKELSAGGLMLILIADQSDRANGIELPFLGRPAFTNRAPAVMALRYECALFAPICYRVGLAKYRIEIGEPIPTHESDGARRTCEAITRDINAAHEASILRDPANWFWVHNRWKQKAAPTPAFVAPERNPSGVSPIPAEAATTTIRV